MRRRLPITLGLLMLVGATACNGGASPEPTETPMQTSASPSETTPSPPATESPSVPPSPEPSPSTEGESLGRSVAHLRSTGDVQATVALRLALNDGFMAVWCDAPNDCAKAANTLQIMGEGLGDPGRHRTQTGDVIVTIELEDRFLYTSTGEGAIEGACLVTFTTSDERGFAGEIECEDITNGFGIGSLKVSVRGTFVAAS
ncbi:MAG: hypothetical protein ACM3WR_00175 [Solirubrobacterales bacterium]